MTVTPDAQQPLTTPPDELVEATRAILPHMEHIISLQEVLDEGRTDAAKAEDRELDIKSADFMRQRFPHLDDVTLASFCAYVATNVTAAVTEAGLCPDALRVAIVFAEMAKHLAWSLTSPDGAGHD